MIAFSLLVALVVYVLLAKFTVKVVGRYTDSKVAKYFIIAIFVLIPTWDIIPGRLYFNQLCETEAGTEVFKTVEVEQSYFLPDGRVDEKKLSNHYVQPDKDDRGFSKLFHIARFESAIQDKQTGEILGRATSFSHFGGWLAAYLAPEGPPSTCPEYHSAHGTIWREVIKPKKDS